MKSIRKKLFIMSYLGNLLVILATFVPLIKFNNQSFAFIDQFFYLSFAIVVIATIGLILIAIKKYKLALIPTGLNIIVIAYGIYNILNIDGLELVGFSHGIAFILYPLGIVLAIIGNLFTISEEKEAPIEYNRSTENIDNTINNNSQELMINEYTDSTQQIPLENIMNNVTAAEITINNTSSENVSENDINNNLQELNMNLEGKEETQINSSSEPKNIEINNQTTESNKINDTFNSFSTEDELLEEIEETEDVPLVTNIQNLDIDNDEIFMDDIIDDIPLTEENKINNVADENLEIPDLAFDSNNLMMNNTQVEDEPKQQFMALNPSDIKIDEHKKLFNKKDKNEVHEDPLEKIMKRNIPSTLGRTCQFCNTPLGDDERICPICGRIN